MSADFAKLIDRERLREAVGNARKLIDAGYVFAPDVVVPLVEAAEAHLATLPEPPKLTWRVYVNDGPNDSCTVCQTAEQALEYVRDAINTADARVEVIVRQVKP